MHRMPYSMMGNPSLSCRCLDLVVSPLNQWSKNDPSPSNIKYYLYMGYVLHWLYMIDGWIDYSYKYDLISS